jgi:hypothetical protein
LDHRRQGNADSLKEGAGASGSGGAKAKPFAGLIDVGLHDLIEVADDIGPESTAGSGKTIDQFLAQKEGKKRAEHMSADRTCQPPFASTTLAGSNVMSSLSRTRVGTTETVISAFSHGRSRLSAPFWADHCQSRTTG